MAEGADGPGSPGDSMPEWLRSASGTLRGFLTDLATAARSAAFRDEAEARQEPARRDRDEEGRARSELHSVPETDDRVDLGLDGSAGRVFERKGRDLDGPDLRDDEREECGNGRMEGGEECDDGGIANADGCDAVCMLECGNSEVGDDPSEECDDGNRDDGDGCSGTCLLECGDGNIDAGEECDDGNTDGDDGCNEECQIECGDGNIDADEECDDGNAVSGDGCSSTCLEVLTSVYAGGYSTCVQLPGGNIRCWGDNGEGQLGLGHLVDVGDKDITAHVNFSAIALAGQDAGLAVLGYTSQARFLFNCGLLPWLEAADLPTRTAAQRLVNEHEMGELFKAIAFVKGPWFDAIGFADGDRSHRL